MLDFAGINHDAGTADSFTTGLHVLYLPVTRLNLALTICTRNATTFV
jgi:hypothetical protein